MTTLKCQYLLDNLNQKDYHFFDDKDIRHVMINMDEKEWFALTDAKKLIKFYLDNPNTGLPDDIIHQGEAAVQHYDKLYYRIAKNRSRMLAPSLSTILIAYEEKTGKELKGIDLNKTIYKWIIAILLAIVYIAWVIMLFMAPGTQPLWLTIVIAIFGGPIFIAELVICIIIPPRLIGLILFGGYDAILEGFNLFYKWRHRKSYYGKLEKLQANYLAARLAPSNKT